MSPIRTLSAIYPIRLRADLPRDVADAYWAGPHAELVKRGGHIAEYRQYHFSATDHGYWPATPTVGTLPHELFRWDGVTEIRLLNLAEMARAAVGMLDTIFHDEQNVFDNVLGHLCGRGGATRWSGSTTEPGHRTVLLLRRRRGTPFRQFKQYVHDRLAVALQAAGALDVRAFTFLPITGITHRTPGLAHVYPPSHRHNGAVIFGLPQRDDVPGLLAAPPVAEVIAEQASVLTAVHAYSVDRTEDVIISDHEVTP
jgi:hypothetical protein